MNTAEFITKATAIHKGYDYSKTVYVKSHSKVTITCVTHGDFTQTPNSHLNGGGCPVCGYEKRRATCVERYGVAHPSQSPEIRKSTKEKVKAKYGVDHYSQHPTVKEKQKATVQSRYGVIAVSLVPEIREKQKATMLERHGVVYAQQSPVIKSKTEDANIAKYGVKNYAQQHMKDVLPLLNARDWVYDQYITQQKTAQAIADELGVDDSTVNEYIKSHNIDIKSSARYSYKSIQWMNDIMNCSGISIQHALNGGEYAIPGTKYRADGFCKDTNTIYEFHGDVYHGNPQLFSPNAKCHPYNDKTAGELYKATVEREQQIKQLGYNLVVMWENDFIAQ